MLITLIVASLHPLIKVLLRRVEDGRCGILGEGLELVLGRFALYRVESTFGDLVDVVGVEVAQLLVERGLLSGRKLVVESLYVSKSAVDQGRVVRPAATVAWGLARYVRSGTKTAAVYYSSSVRIPCPHEWFVLGV